jgi:hypothetical protein
MPNSRHTEKANSTVARPRQTGWFRGNRWLEVGIAVAFAAVLLYVISVSVRVSTGVSRTLEGPRHLVRLQILNGCGVSGLAGRMADKVADFQDDDIEIRVLDTDNFDLRQVDRSFVISREEDLGPARLLAAKLGMETTQVQYAALENNYRQISVTLVLGEDWESLHLPGSAAGE